MGLLAADAEGVGDGGEAVGLPCLVHGCPEELVGLGVELVGLGGEVSCFALGELELCERPWCHHGGGMVGGGSDVFGCGGGFALGRVVGVSGVGA